MLKNIKIKILGGLWLFAVNDKIPDDMILKNVLILMK